VTTWITDFASHEGCHTPTFFLCSKQSVIFISWHFDSGWHPNRTKSHQEWHVQRVSLWMGLIEDEMSSRQGIKLRVTMTQRKVMVRVGVLSVSAWDAAEGRSSDLTRKKFGITVNLSKFRKAGWWRRSRFFQVSVLVWGRWCNLISVYFHGYHHFIIIPELNPELNLPFFGNFRRYGSELVEVDSWASHNWTVSLARRFSHGDPNFWLGYNTLDDLRTNTLDSPSGSLLSQFAGQYVRMNRTFAEPTPTFLNFYFNKRKSRTILWGGWEEWRNCIPNLKLNPQDITRHSSFPSFSFNRRPTMVSMKVKLRGWVSSDIFPSVDIRETWLSFALRITTRLTPTGFQLLVKFNEDKVKVINPEYLDEVSLIKRRKRRSAESETRQQTLHPFRCCVCREIFVNL